MEWSAHAIFCDDIRQEFNGKVILIGIYQGSLVTPAFPLATQLATYVDVRHVTDGEHEFAIKAQYESNGEIIEVATLVNHIDVTDPDLPTIIQGGGMNLVVEKPGKLMIWLSVDGDKPKIVGTLKVSANENLAIAEA